MITLKIGGSLLNYPNLKQHLLHFLDTLPFQNLLIVVGGSVMAQHIRDFTHRHHLSEQQTYPMAIESMLINSHLCRNLIDDGVWADTPEEVIPLKDKNRLLWINPKTWFDWHLRNNIFSNRTLSFTSDSITYQCAIDTQSEACYLLKSTEFEHSINIDQACELNLVDSSLKRLYRENPLCYYINLRSSSPELRLIEP